MNNYAHPDFEDIMKDEFNLSCFDCNKKPAQWASVNNAIYLCLNCAGGHRGFGVNISYIRSTTMDSWNENQISMMKNGGNGRLRDLLKIYEIKSNYSKDLLYSTKLLDFYRRLLKSEISGDAQPTPPEQKNALLPYEQTISLTPSTTNDKFASVGSSQNITEKKTGFMNSVNLFMSNAVDKTKVLATSVKEKVNEMDIGNKVKSTGVLAMEKFKEATEKVKEKSSEAMQSSTVQNMKKKANDGYNYFYEKIFGAKTDPVEENSKETSKNEEYTFVSDGNCKVGKINNSNISQQNNH